MFSQNCSYTGCSYFLMDVSAMDLTFFRVTNLICRCTIHAASLFAVLIFLMFILHIQGVQILPSAPARKNLSSYLSQIKLLLYYKFWLFVCGRACQYEHPVYTRCAYTGCSYFIIGVGAMDLTNTVS